MDAPNGPNGSTKHGVQHVQDREVDQVRPFHQHENGEQIGWVLRGRPDSRARTTCGGSAIWKGHTRSLELLSGIEGPPPVGAYRIVAVKIWQLHVPGNRTVRSVGSAAATRGGPWTLDLSLSERP
jgi:hypothetical protein